METIEGHIKKICIEVASGKQDVPENYHELIENLCFQIVALEFSHNIARIEINKKIQDVLHDASVKLSNHREES